MADVLTTSILARIQGTRKVDMGVGTQLYPATVEENLAWPDGTAVSKANEMWTDDAGSVAAAAHVNLDLFAAVQVDAAGATTGRTVSFAKVKALFIRNTSAANYIKIGGGTDGTGVAADAWIDAVGTEGWLADDSDFIHLPAGGCLLLEFPSGVTVSNGTSHILHLGGITSTQTYEIIVIGLTA